MTSTSAPPIPAAGPLAAPLAATAADLATNAAVVERGKDVLIGNYGRLPVALARGQGSHLWDADGKQYLDLFAGFGGTILGHCHPELVAAAAEQAGRLWAVGNQFYSTPQIEFAERLNRHAFAGKAFFCHSGAEANEAATKLARLRGSHNPGAGGRPRWKLISLNKSFHGRTLAMLAANGNPTYRQGFGPTVPGFVNVEPGDFDALVGAADDETCGVIFEPIQGEGGVNHYPADYPRRVRDFCTQRGLTLIFDEVWTGCGRTGKWFAHQHFTTPEGGTVEPDVMTLGKAAGGGLPVGVMFAKPELASLMVPGTHGCTLGGNPICMAVARTLFDVIERDDLTSRAARLGQIAVRRLREEPALSGKIADVRGRGLMLGIELTSPPQGLVERALARGLIVNVTAQKVVRLAPALTIGEADWQAGLDALVSVIAES